MICGGKVAEQQKKKAAIGQRGEKEHAGQGQVSGKILVVDPDEKNQDAQAAQHSGGHRQAEPEEHLPPDHLVPVLCRHTQVDGSLKAPPLLAGIGELLDSQQGEAADHQDAPGVCADQGQQEQVGDAFVGLQGVQTDVEVFRGEAA